MKRALEYCIKYDVKVIHKQQTHLKVESTITIIAIASATHHHIVAFIPFKLEFAISVN